MAGNDIFHKFSTFIKNPVPAQDEGEEVGGPPVLCHTGEPQAGPQVLRPLRPLLASPSLPIPQRPGTPSLSPPAWFSTAEPGYPWQNRGGPTWATQEQCGHQGRLADEATWQGGLSKAAGPMPAAGCCPDPACCCPPCSTAAKPAEGPAEAG